MRRLDEWARAGVFERLHLQVLDRLGELDQLDWSQASVDSASVRANPVVASLEASSTWSATPAGYR